MIIFKKLSLIMGIFIYIIIGFGLRIFLLSVSPSVRFRSISRLTKMFNRFLRLIFRIKIIIEGERSALKERGSFIVSNHLSYLDGIVLGSIFPVIYTSKSEVRHWPLLGWMTEAGGTIFIDRKRKTRSVDYIQEATQMLKRKINVIVFPEGTSTNGAKLLPFQSIHFQAPLNSRCPILPIAINYTKINQEDVGLENRDRVCWHGQVKFPEHLLGVLNLESIEAKIVIYPKVDLASLSGSDYSRKELSEALYKIIERNYPLFERRQ